MPATAGRRAQRLRLAVSAGAFAAGAVLARRPGLHEREAAWFHAVNRLPDGAYALVWPVMQLGSLAGPYAVAAAAAAAGRPTLARRVAAVGTLAWLGSKAVKPFVQRGRPRAVLDGARVLGKDQTGLGYPSGHAAVSVAVAIVAAPELPPALRPALWVWALAVGPMRVYVGAHLPLDVAGGIALGVATATAVGLTDPG